MTHSRRIVGHKSAAENAPVDQARCAAWLVRQHRLDGDPFLIGESAAHDSRPKVRNLESQPSRRLQPCERSCITAVARTMVGHLRLRAPTLFWSNMRAGGIRSQQSSAMSSTRQLLRPLLLLRRLSRCSLHSTRRRLRTDNPPIGSPSCLVCQPTSGFPPNLPRITRMKF